MRDQLIRAARAAGVLPAAERVRFVADYAKRLPRNRSFAAEHPGTPMPPAWLAYDAFGRVDYARYWRYGSEAADYVTGVARSHLGDEVVVCEWGCGPGRVLRHLIGREPFTEVIGTDYNEKTIEWCRRALPGARFVVNGTEPPLDLPDDSVDFLYSVSVYTHLSRENGERWLADNLRVVKPGGLVMMTVQSDRFTGKLVGAEREQYESEGQVIRSGAREGSRIFSAFHSPTFMREQFLAGREIVVYDSDPPMGIGGGQDVWVVRA